MEIYTDNKVVGYYSVTTGTDQTAFGLTPTTGSWVDVAYSWDKPNDDHSANPGDGVWASTWEDDDNEITSAQTNNINEVFIGNDNGAHPVWTTEYIYITDFAIVSGYKQACPWQ